MKAGIDKVHREDAGTAILHDRDGPKDKKITKNSPGHATLG